MTRVPFPLIVTGAGGRIGCMLRRVLPAGRMIWVTRRPQHPGDLGWDDFVQGSHDGAVIVHLAGAVQGDLSINATLAKQVCLVKGARHVFVASSAAVYAPAAVDLQEDMPPAPQNAYGTAKLEMEAAIAGDGVTILRIGNVAGADALLGGLRRGVTCVLDPVAGQVGGPHRSYIGPVTLGRTLMKLAEMANAAIALPTVLNVSEPGAVAMADLLQAAGADWRYGPVKDSVVPRVVLDVARLGGLVPLAPARADRLVAEWRAAT